MLPRTKILRLAILDAPVQIFSKVAPKQFEIATGMQTSTLLLSERSLGTGTTRDILHKSEYIEFLITKL